ncbi:PREDICTED: uncharacterized protein LOC101297116 [Fragaria vesca subsp. vesca]|uniref:uncharacterized protein LOC101297116 n=1 Tax=Fragaria vesca subsp. vesca TaxID=101020 RepID=UPI0002C3568E|nr:PREDICTED: uncharacterized protein LOC101297116 [Fragaria vesca subsp. vesca]
MLPLSPSEPIDDPRDNPEGKEKKKQVSRPNPAEETEWVSQSTNAPERKVRIGNNLDPELRQKLITFLQDKHAVFAWSYADMPSISPDIITHKLNILKDYPPVRQKRRAFNPEKYRAIQAEVQRLKEIKFIREVSYPTWVSNVVMVPKPNGKWRMCVDYTNLNKACPMDSFPLSRIDQLVNSTAGYKMLNFLDAYSGYNQIKMHPTNQEHTTFVTDKGLYCYGVMPFGLKNAGATYQRLVNAMFEEEIGELMEGFMVSERGIEANPEKIQAILDMTVLSTRNEVQCLTGRLVALVRFISRLTDRCNPLFQLLKSQYKENVTWGLEHDDAFNNIKAYLAAVPLLSKPVPGEVLYLNLVVSATAISAALTRHEHDNELPIYYCGRGFADPETRDSQLVVNQVAGDFKANQNNLGSYKSLAGALLQHFTSYKLTQILRAKNSKADALARLATAPPESTPPDVHIEILDKPSISKAYLEIFTLKTTSQPSWMDPYVDFLSNSTLSQDKREAQRLRHKASLYLLKDGKLYRRGQSCPFLKCLPIEEGHKVLTSLHSGVCGNHAGARNLMFKALRAGHYWPTLEQDAKWIEAEPFATITIEKVINFLWRNLYCWFGVPQAFITDNGTQFDNDTFREFLSKQGTTIFYASPAHPQTNGQVEAINKLIKQNLRKRLEDAKGLWAAKLPEVLWTLRTTATGESPYLWRSAETEHTSGMSTINRKLLNTTTGKLFPAP